MYTGNTYWTQNICFCVCVYMRMGEYMCSCVFVSHVYIMYYYVTITTTKEEDINLKGGEFDVVEDGAERKGWE